jgi:hypothetical protein
MSAALHGAQKAQSHIEEKILLGLYPEWYQVYAVPIK